MQGSTTRTVPQNLRARIKIAVLKYHSAELDQLFSDILAYIDDSSAALQSQQPNAQEEPKSKKRKLEFHDTVAVDSIAEISFSVPQRKKLRLELGKNVDGGAIRATNPATQEVEFAIPWSEVEHCVCLPVPEKAQPQYNYCVFSRTSDEQILFTVPGHKIKPENITSESVIDPEESYKITVTRMLNKRLKTKVLEPDEKEFVSQVAQAHRKGERAVHVKAFKGTKDGYLFFLPTGILWGFKKPLSFFPFHAITSISYTSVLQRTFNLNISILSPTTSSSSQEEANNNNNSHEFEFSMIDQADFAGIDAYVKRHGLQDASMAEQRRAKKSNVNGVSGNAEGGEEGGELEKAQREVEEEEDEEDENFDPGSEGESEGSGSSSEEEEEEGGGNPAGDGDLVEEELGSEAEDVSE
ncbi:MAG: hypothetical protein Q9219_000124 [cf. Caloplaca sp. 3 TL-2023]